MATYLIDFENVKSEGIKGITQLDSNDSVVIFYSQNADTITFEAMDMIFSTKASVRKYKILRGGKNALDFQLSTYLGYLIHEGSDSYFYIISRDNGFQHVVEFWKRTFGYDGYVFCFPTIAEGNARQSRFRTASAKERELVIAKDLEAMHRALEEVEEEEEAIKEAEERFRKEDIEETPVSNDDRFFNIYPTEELGEELKKQQQARAERGRRYEQRREQRKAEPARAAAEPVPAKAAAAEAPAPQEKPVAVAEKPAAVTEEPAPVPAVPDGTAGIAAQSSHKEEFQAVYSEPQKQPAAWTESFETAVQDDEYDEFVNDGGSAISVQPPEEMPDSVRESLRLADEKAAAEAAKKPGKNAAELESAIAAAAMVSEMKVTQVDNNLTVHQVTDTQIMPEEPVADEKPAESAEKPAAKKKTHRGGKKSGKSAKAEKAEKPAEEKPVKAEKGEKESKAREIGKPEAEKTAEDSAKAEEAPAVTTENQPEQAAPAEEPKETRKKRTPAKRSRTAKAKEEVPAEAAAEQGAETAPAQEKAAEEKPAAKKTAGKSRKSTSAKKAEKTETAKSEEASAEPQAETKTKGRSRTSKKAVKKEQEET